MEIRVVYADITQIPANAIIVNLFEGVTSLGGATRVVDGALGGTITQLIADGEIKGKLNEITLIHTQGRIAPARVVVMGLGKEADLTADRLRDVSAEALKFLHRKGAKQVATIVHGAGAGGIDTTVAAQSVVEGALLGLYVFRQHMTKEPDFEDIQELSVVEQDEAKRAAVEEGCNRGRIMAEATNLARNLVNEPANALTPTILAERAKALAEAWNLEYAVLDREQMSELGMGALLGVAQGSHQPPKLMTLTYRGGGSTSLGLVGKGITFDSGGISLKPAQGMGEMKGDMAGGAAVIATMRAIAELKPKINVTAIVPATENLPGGAALKPADVLRAMNGKTIEVESTDAEGRMILADALCYARKLELSPLVDVATLTGACAIALGPFCTGAFGNNQELVDKLIQAGNRAGEYIWQMPMYQEFKDLNKSDVADIKNTGGREGGAITAAQFLAEFVEDTPWVHLDIAGTSFSDKERTYRPKGAVGVAVRTLVNLAIDMAEK
ncbi:MAG: leucyl aminopeptidase [Chloroflexi bacterium]|nr:leucyl aminopeptidase [Chloroflexota bacterium]